MALLTSWSEIEARRTLAEYGVELARVEPLAAGSVNSNFAIVLDDGRKLFARIYEEQDRDGALAELGLLGRLAAAGVRTPMPLERSDGGALSEHAGKPIAVFPWIDGTVRCQAAVTPEDCRRLGEALARLHLVPVPDADIPAGRFDVKKLGERLDRIEAEAPGELARVASELRESLVLWARRRDETLPGGLVHGDLFRDNVLWNENELAALIDFESVSRGAYVYDLAVCVHAWCYSSRFEAELVSALVRGYNAVRPLEPREMQGARAEAAIAALRFAITRITDYSLRAPPGRPPLRDYRRFVDRLSAVSAGALDGALAGLR